MIGIQRDHDAAEIRDILTHGQLRIDMQSGNRLESGVLRAEYRRAGLEGVRIRLAPPVAQSAARVELAALVVEAVRQFMANDGADGAEVYRRVGVGIEIRRLQDRGRKHD